MYIREDLLNKIKEIFNIKELIYVGTGKHFYNNNDMSISDCVDEVVALVVKNCYLFSLHTKLKTIIIVLDALIRLQKETSYFQKKMRLT